MKIFTYHHCDEWQSHRSMGVADTFYPDTKEGRAKLLKDIKADISDGSVELIGDVGFLNLDINSGNIINANERLVYGYINVLYDATEEA